MSSLPAPDCRHCDQPAPTHIADLITAILALREAERQPLHHHVIDARQEAVADLYDRLGPWTPQANHLLEMAVQLALLAAQDGAQVEQLREILGLA